MPEMEEKQRQRVVAKKFKDGRFMVFDAQTHSDYNLPGYLNNH